MDSLKNAKNKTISFEALYCDAALGKIDSIPTDKAQTVKYSCAKAHVYGRLSCKNPYFSLFVDEAEGFQLTNKVVTGIDLPLLRRYIPIPPNVRTAHWSLHVSLPPVVGMRLKDLLPGALSSRDGDLQYHRNSEVDMKYTQLKPFSGRSVILFSSGPDVLVEGVMRDREGIDIFRKVGSLGFIAVTGLDLSVNGGDCYAGQMLNIGRSLVYSREMEHYGTPAIPNVFAVDSYQVQAWIRYLHEYQVPLVSINCQLQRRSNEDVELLREVILELLSGVRYPLRIILHGFPLTRKHLGGLESVISQLYFADSAPFFDAERGKTSFFDPTLGEIVTTPGKIKGITEVELAERGIAAREEFLSALVVEQMPRLFFKCEEKVPGE